tara:strand:- start:370 stop:561 length:192 start_codon:yes stop_codon:yes gene_type:complete
MTRTARNREQVIRANLMMSITSLERQLEVCKNANEIARLELEVKELQQQLDGEIDGVVKSESF